MTPTSKVTRVETDFYRGIWPGAEATVYRKVRAESYGGFEIVEHVFTWGNISPAILRRIARAVTALIEAAQ